MFFYYSNDDILPFSLYCSFLMLITEASKAKNMTISSKINSMSSIPWKNVQLLACVVLNYGNNSSILSISPILLLISYFLVFMNGDERPQKCEVQRAFQCTPFHDKKNVGEFSLLYGYDNIVMFYYISLFYC